MNTLRVQFKFALMAMVFIMAFGYSDDITPSSQKKINKEIKAIWPEQSIESDEFVLNIDQTLEANKIGIEQVISLYNEEDLVGYLVYLHVPSKFDTFDIGIIYSRDIHIESMKVLAYREDHGGEVGSKRWLKQFKGLSIESPIKLNDDIQGISGATISCEAATIGAKEVTNFLSGLVLLK